MATAHGATRSSLFGLDVFVGCWKLNCAHPNSQLRWHFRWKGEKGASSFPEEAAEYLDTLITMPTWMRMDLHPQSICRPGRGHRKTRRPTGAAALELRPLARGAWHPSSHGYPPCSHAMTNTQMTDSWQGKYAMSSCNVWMSTLLVVT